MHTYLNTCTLLDNGAFLTSAELQTERREQSFSLQTRPDGVFTSFALDPSLKVSLTLVLAMNVSLSTNFTNLALRAESGLPRISSVIAFLD